MVGGSLQVLRLLPPLKQSTIYPRGAHEPLFTDTIKKKISAIKIKKFVLS
jgi:hypothetical protein